MRFARLGVYSTALVAAMLIGDSAHAQLDIRLGHTNQPSHNWHVALTGFAEEVAEATDGRVNISVYPSAQLGSEREVMEGLQIGTVHASLLSSGTFQSVEPKLAVVELPYMWPTNEHAYNAYDGELGDALADLLEDDGFVVLAWWENGFRHITTAGEPVLTPDDLHGLKIRVAQEQLRIDSFKEMGAEPGPLAYGEVYSALQQGVFDAQEGPLSAIYASSFYEVQSSVSLTGHIFSPASLTFASDVWNRIDPEDQEIIREAAIKWGNEQRRMTTEVDLEMIEALEDEGMTVVEVDTAPFAEAAQPVWEQYKPVFGEELLELVEKYRQ